MQVDRSALLREWPVHLKRLSIEDLAGRKELLAMMQAAFGAEPNANESEALQEMREEVEDSLDYWIRKVHGEHPIRFLKPSLEQAMVLNAWHPAARTEGFENIDAERVPDFLDYEGGYQSIGNFTCNRGGKTFVCCWDTVLWNTPYEDDWEMFRWHDDWLGRGRYRVLPRPDWEVWRRRGKLRYNGAAAPPMGAATVWHGISRDDDWTQKVYPAYRILIPQAEMGRRPDGEEAVYKLEKRFETKWGHQIIGMSMGAKAITWAGKQCVRLNVDEGILKDHLVEGITRLVGGGYYQQAYTPAEAANTAEMAQVAKFIFQRKEGYELRGKSKFFVHFRLADVPDWIIDPQKKAEDIKRFEGLGAAGKSRSMGGFFDSSPVVFTNYNRALHVLPWGSNEIADAINGKGPTELVQIFYKANIIRGADEGTANPSACVWGALLRTGEVVFYRGWEKSGISITQRVDAIIDLSGNVREEVGTIRKTEETEQEVNQYAQALQRDLARAETTGVFLKRYREREVRETIRATYMDYKAFKKDPNNPGENWMENYRRAGLRVEPSAHIGPASRCDYLNELLMRDNTRKHLNPMQGTVGSRAYVSKDCTKLIERLENYLQGQRQDGTFSGKPETEDDHTVDGACYIVCANLRWIDPEMLKQNRALARAQLQGAQPMPACPMTGY